MNRSVLLNSLSAILENFIVLSKLLHELVEILSESGTESTFFNALLLRLKLLAEFGTAAVLNAPAFFEHLKQSDGLYSMRIKSSNLNIRILYAFLPDGAPILLHAFYERAGKHKTDYAQHIPVAQQRLKEYLEGNVS